MFTCPLIWTWFLILWLFRSSHNFFETKISPLWVVFIWLIYSLHQIFSYYFQILIIWGSIRAKISFCETDNIKSLNCNIFSDRNRRQRTQIAKDRYEFLFLENSYICPCKRINYWKPSFLFNIFSDWTAIEILKEVVGLRFY